MGGGRTAAPACTSSARLSSRLHSASSETRSKICRGLRTLAFVAHAAEWPGSRLSYRVCGHEQARVPTAAIAGTGLNPTTWHCSNRLGPDDHPPTDEPQQCRTCGTVLPATFFRLACRLPLGRYTSGCLACDSEAKLRFAQQIPDVPDAKRCGRCHQEKPAPDFPDRRASPDGLQNWCRRCLSAYVAARKAPLVRVTVSSKWCCKCGEVKPAARFTTSDVSGDGLHWVCKPCAALASRQQRSRRAGTRQ